MARAEAYRKHSHRPPYYIHKWWARRTGSVFRGIALDMLLPPRKGVMENYYEAHDFSDAVILDPFMGGGTTVGEALRLGAKVVGCDLNPVAWFLVSQAMRAVDGDALDAGFDQVRRAVERRIARMYETTCGQCGGAADIQYTAWLKQIDCSACGELVDLNRSHVVMQDFGLKGAGLVDCPRCALPWRVKNVNARVQCPECRHRFVPSHKPVANKYYWCQCCKNSEPIYDVVSKLDAPPGHRMRSVHLWCENCGRVHQRPSEADVAQYARIERRVKRTWRELLIPHEAIPAGTNTDQMRNYGYRYWHQMFNARQLAGLSMVFSAIRDLEDPAVRELLTLHASSTLEFNSIFCGAKGLGTGAIRQVFAHHAFIPTKEPLEAHVWGVKGSSGGFASLYRTRLLKAREWAN
ncbi:MAG TPA: DNA methyltransferase, partial [Anaeromyxobacteraceae bacterium]|nr:DNA methyltransferase [Anaeromyxobacteraceae bacterium]